MKSIFSYFGRILYSIDQLFNVILYPILNLFLADGSYKFGNPDETISSVLGKNIELGRCRGCYFICRFILHPIDKGHCKRAIEEDEHTEIK
jgi:hypothetical protein